MQTKYDRLVAVSHELVKIQERLNACLFEKDFTDIQGVTENINQINSNIENERIKIKEKLKLL